MLQLKHITKVYVTGDEEVHALRDVSIDFRANEFVSILGPSGCGKTTLLNIIGGLDRYTEGDLIIRGISTREYRDADWDTYRNHSIGFVFQSYNLIPHQTVLSNVELALTLSGVSAGERRARAEEALRAVGLGDQLKKKPSQMSGGQMQRVAIARALVNNPDILLADEPTGALDSATSVQIMDLLREVARDRLVIMVTHNPDLAEHYSTRIIRLSDGQVVDDTAPYDATADVAASLAQTAEAEEKEEQERAAAVARGEKVRKKEKKKKKHTSMSFFTALSLSFNNLLTKKGRTMLTSFAGSIGIIGIALILALSNGISIFIDKVQEDTLSSTPVRIEASTLDMNALLSSMTGSSGTPPVAQDGIVTSNPSVAQMINALRAGIVENDLVSFKEYLESEDCDIVSGGYATIQYDYGVTPMIYQIKEDGTPLGVNPSAVYNSLLGAIGMDSQMYSSSLEVFDEILDDSELIESQYDVLAGTFPSSFDQVVLVVDEYNRIPDLMLYILGLLPQEELLDIMMGKQPETTTASFTYEDLLGQTYRMVLAADLYADNGDGTYTDKRNDTAYMKTLLASDKAVTLEICGIVRPKPDATATAISGVIGYTNDLTRYLIDEGAKHPLVQKQLADPTVDVITGLPFADEEAQTTAEKVEKLLAYYEKMTDEELAALYRTELLPNEVMEKLYQEKYQALIGQEKSAMQATLVALLQEHPELLGSMEGGGDITLEQLMGILAFLDEEQIRTMLASAQTTLDFEARLAEALVSAAAEPVSALAARYREYIDGLTASEKAEKWDELNAKGYAKTTYQENLDLLGIVDYDDPRAINIYAKSFDAKEHVTSVIQQYNDAHPGQEITYTDYIALVLSSVSVILDVITYVLIAFVSISLVVSSIMIGIITYISVLERTKEIGILRAIGASKRDISRVFNAETLIVGFTAGLIGILATLIFILPINAIIRALSGFANIGASLPVLAALILIAISMALTLIAGLIPSRLAAKKDPVVALRSE